MTANKDTYTIFCATFITIYMESLKNMYPHRTLILILCKHQAIGERRVLLAYQILQKRHLVRHLSSTTEFKSNLSDFFLGFHESKNTGTWRVIKKCVMSGKGDEWMLGMLFLPTRYGGIVSAYTIATTTWSLLVGIPHISQRESKHEIHLKTSHGRTRYRVGWQEQDMSGNRMGDLSAKPVEGEITVPQFLAEVKKIDAGIARIW